mgnify:CR=1 FL=1
MAVKSFNEYVEIKTTNNIIDDDGHLKDLSDDSVIEKLNTFVGSISDREYLVAEKAVDELRQKLMRVGLHFGDVQFTEESGEISVPLVQYGGAFGKSGDTPYDEFARKIITASGSNKVNPPASYYKVLREPTEIMENTTQLFLATRFNCNKCHDHPFERWTQDQYYETTAYFAQVGLKKDDKSGDKRIGGTAVEGAKPLYEIIYDRNEGETKHDRTCLLYTSPSPRDS